MHLHPADILSQTNKYFTIGECGNIDTRAHNFMQSAIADVYEDNGTALRKDHPELLSAIADVYGYIGTRSRGGSSSLWSAVADVCRYIGTTVDNGHMHSYQP